MESEQTKDFREAVNGDYAHEYGFTKRGAAFFLENLIRIDALESAERERQPTLAPAAEPMKPGSPFLCEHANESPAVCNCPPNCYCKTHTCKPAPPPADVVRGEAKALLDVCIEEFGGPSQWPDTEAVMAGKDGQQSPITFGHLRRLEAALSSPAPDVRAEAEMEMWKRCREAVVGVNYIDKWGCTRHGGNVYEDCRAAIDTLKPTAPAGTGGEGGGRRDDFNSFAG